MAAGENKLRRELFLPRMGSDTDMENHEVTGKQPLLDDKGKITEPGWARSPVWEYDRNRVPSLPLRIKEQDSYLVMGEEYGVLFTVSDDGYMGSGSVSILHFREKWEHTESVRTPFPLGKFKMPASAEQGDVVYRDKKLRLEFRVEAGQRMISCDFKEFYQGKPFYCEITLEQPPMDRIAVAAPSKGNRAFYYSQKINCMPAEGYMSFDNQTYWFNPEHDYGTLSWERGVRPFGHTWYWSSGNGTVGGKPFGFNLGYEPGDVSEVSENILFYDGKGHKLDRVIFHVPEEDYMKTWTFTSGDGRFEMEFEPVIGRLENLSALFASSGKHQVFGRMKGRAVLDDGRFIELKDFMCFAEKVRGKY